MWLGSGIPAIDGCAASDEGAGDGEGFGEAFEVGGAGDFVGSELS
jgi:hypothetical protein